MNKTPKRASAACGDAIKTSLIFTRNIIDYLRDGWPSLYMNTIKAVRAQERERDRKANHSSRKLHWNGSCFIPFQPSATSITLPTPTLLFLLAHLLISVTNSRLFFLSLSLSLYHYIILQLLQEGHEKGQIIDDDEMKIEKIKPASEIVDGNRLLRKNFWINNFFYLYLVENCVSFRPFGIWKKKNGTTQRATL